MDWPYAGIDFTGDLDLRLQEGKDWDEELGKTLFYFMNFMIFLVYIHVLTIDPICM